MVEMAMPADGTEHEVKPNKIQVSSQNLDSDEDIYQATQKDGKKWRYFIDGEMIAEADAPAGIDAGVLSSWGNAIRARCKRKLTLEDETRKEEARKRKAEAKSDGGIIIPDGAVLEDAVVDVSADVRDDAPAATLDDDPDSYVDGKITAAKKRMQAIAVKIAELDEEREHLETEKAAASKEYGKWTKMKEAINAEV